MKTTGEIIREIRTEKGMSIEELAEKVGKSRQTIWRYENGNIEKLPYNILVPIAKALNTTPLVLLGVEESKEDTILSLFKSLSSEQQDLLISMAKELVRNGNNKKQ